MCRQLGFLVAVWTASATGHDAERRRPAAHVHGTAELQIMLEETGATAALRIAGMSAVGFERVPRSDAERGRLDRFRSAVASAGWLAFPASAGCQLSGSNVSAPGFEETPSDEETEGEHAEIRATLRYRCTNGDRTSELSVNLFEPAHELQTVRVEWITPLSQGGAVVERGQRRVSLAP